MATVDLRTTLLNNIVTASGGACVSIAEYKDSQFGMPLRHYAQQYLYGSTGLRFNMLHSISGPPQSCKSPFVFDLMFDMCRDAESGGPEGLSFLYEMEGKLSPTLLASMAEYHGQSYGNGTPFQILGNVTIEDASKHLSRVIIKNLRNADLTKIPPIFIDWDSVGGAASESLVDKFESEGVVGKGFHDKAHIMKHFCEQWGALSKFLPIVFMVVNQEKKDVESTPGYTGPAKKHITGGESQVFKAGHIVSASYRAMSDGSGKIVTLRTTKTSFCDPRKVEVNFVWDRAGQSDSNAQGHHWEWALAGAQLLANPAYVGDLRSIIDVKVSKDNLVTCPQLDCRSVHPDQFEAALFDPANADLLKRLYAYQKIEVIKGIDEYRDYLRSKKDDAKALAEQQKEQRKAAKEAEKAAKEAEAAAKEAKKQDRLNKAEAKKAKLLAKAVPKAQPKLQPTVIRPFEDEEEGGQDGGQPTGATEPDTGAEEGVS